MELDGTTRDSKSLGTRVNVVENIIVPAGTGGGVYSYKSIRDFARRRSHEKLPKKPARRYYYVRGYEQTPFVVT